MCDLPWCNISRIQFVCTVCSVVPTDQRCQIVFLNIGNTPEIDDLYYFIHTNRIVIISKYALIELVKIIISDHDVFRSLSRIVITLSS